MYDLLPDWEGELKVLEVGEGEGPGEVYADGELYNRLEGEGEV